MGIGGYYESDYSNPACDSIKRLSILLTTDSHSLIPPEWLLYGAGHSEELIGKAITGRREDRILVGSKFSPENSRKDDVINAAHNSLKIKTILNI